MNVAHHSGFFSPTTYVSIDTKLSLSLDLTWSLYSDNNFGVKVKGDQMDVQVHTKIIRPFALHLSRFSLLRRAVMGLGNSSSKKTVFLYRVCISCISELSKENQNTAK